MKTFVTFLLLVLVVVDGQKKSNEYVSIFKRKHLFPVFVFLPDFWIVDKGVVGEFGGVFFLAIYYFDEGTCKKGLWRVCDEICWVLLGGQRGSIWILLRIVWSRYLCEFNINNTSENKAGIKKI